MGIESVYGGVWRAMTNCGQILAVFRTSQKRMTLNATPRGSVLRVTPPRQCSTELDGGQRCSMVSRNVIHRWPTDVHTAWFVRMSRVTLGQLPATPTSMMSSICRRQSLGSRNSPGTRLLIVGYARTSIYAMFVRYGIFDEVENRVPGRMISLGKIVVIERNTFRLNTSIIRKQSL